MELLAKKSHDSVITTVGCKSGQGGSRTRDDVYVEKFALKNVGMVTKREL